ncbi:hypothetical protein H4684_003956, partial [Desulfomicrobium macestii]|nr:hypothetical protein [Desulfomicrobium macestii]
MNFFTKVWIATEKMDTDREVKPPCFAVSDKMIFRMPRD